eukprot:TRINITY_DN3652_c0_g1_i1.p1 TRINITY_DN3652_c0_g1~~TRINITY_DN3652_c0_g1_i1.p1  ORF type:complete len:2249 (+),score=470.10 TRINITY_DN3652_c0_g1_i1:88-6834(+)
MGMSPGGAADDGAGLEQCPQSCTPLFELSGISAPPTTSPVDWPRADHLPAAPCNRRLEAGSLPRSPVFVAPSQAAESWRSSGMWVLQATPASAAQPEPAPPRPLPLLPSSVRHQVKGDYQPTAEDSSEHADLDQQEDAAGDGTNVVTEPIEAISIGSARLADMLRAPPGGPSGLDRLETVRGRVATYNFAASSLFVFGATNPLRVRFFDALNTKCFENLTLALIIANSVTLGMDIPATSDNQGVQDFLFISEVFFQTVFTLEMMIKVVALGLCAHPNSYLRNSWNFVDGVIVVSGFSIFISGSNVSVLRLLRVARPLRSVSRVAGMRTLMTTIIASLPNLLEVGILLGFLMLVFSITGIGLFAGRWHDRCHVVNASGVYPILNDSDTPCSRSLGGRHCTDLALASGNSQQCLRAAYSDTILNFDNILHALLLSFKIISLDDWPTDMTKAQDATSFYAFIFFFAMTIMGAYFCINLVLALLSMSFDENKASEDVDAVQLAAIRFRHQGAEVSISSAIVTNPDGVNPLGAEAHHLVDHNPSTRWTDLNLDRMPYVVFTLRCPVTIDEYTLVTAPDCPGRDPVQWALEGAETPTSTVWTLLHQQDEDFPTADERSTELPWFPLPDGPAKCALLRFVVAKRRADFDFEQETEGTDTETDDLSARGFTQPEIIPPSGNNTPPPREETNPSEPPTPSPPGAQESPQSSSQAPPTVLTTPPPVAVASVGPPRGPGASAGLSSGAGSPIRSPPPAATPHAQNVLACVASRLDLKRKQGSWSSGSGSPHQVVRASPAAGPAVQPRPTVNFSPAARLGDPSRASSFGQPQRSSVWQPQGLSAAGPTARLSVAFARPSLRPSRGRSVSIGSRQISAGSDEPRPLVTLAPMRRPLGSLAMRIISPDQASRSFVRRGRSQSIAQSKSHASFGKSSKGATSTQSRLRGLALWQQRVRTVVTHKAFSFFMLGVTLINICSMAMDHHGIDDAWNDSLCLINLVCSILFVVEMLVKWFGFFAPKPAGTYRQYVNDAYNVFDCLLVFISVPELVAATGGGCGGVGGAMSAFRAFRLARVARVAQRLPKLRRLLQTIVESLTQDVPYLLLIMFLVIYVFGILGLQMFEGQLPSAPYRLPKDYAPEERNNFDTLLRSMLTTFVIITGESWATIMKHAMLGTSGAACLYFLVLFAFGNYVLLNLVVAILIVNFSAASREIAEEDDGADEAAPPQAGAVDALDRLDALKIALGEIESTPPATLPIAVEPLMSPAPEDDEQEDAPCPLPQPKVGSAHPARSTASNPLSCPGPSPSGAPPAARRTKALVSSPIQSQCSGGLLSPKAETEACDGEDIMKLRLKSLDSDKPRSVFRQMIQERKERAMSATNQLSDLRGRSLGIFTTTNPVRVFATRVVLNPFFDWAVTSIIFLNIVFLALDDTKADSRVPGYDRTQNRVVTYSDIVFTILFCAEAAAKMIVYGLTNKEKKGYLNNPWNRIDLFVCITALLGLAIEEFKLFRSLRAVRLIILAPGVRVLVLSLSTALPQIGYVCLVCSFIWLVFAVLGVQLFKGSFYYCSDIEIEYRKDCTGTFTRTVAQWDGSATALAPRQWLRTEYHFDNVGAAMLTLFVIAIGDGWAEIMYTGIDSSLDAERALRKDQSPAVSVFFLVFVLVGGLFAINLFVGMLIEQFEAQKQELIGLTENGVPVLTESQCTWLHARKIIERTGLKARQPRPVNDMHAALIAAVLNPWFDHIVMVFITINVIFMCIAHEGQSADITMMLSVVNRIFVALYTMEAVIKNVALTPKLYWSDNWNRFDALLVSTSWAGLFVDGPATASLRVLRIGRLFRLVKRARTLQQLFSTLLHALPGLGNIAVFLMIVFFVFGVVGVSLFGRVTLGCDDCLGNHGNFRTLGQAVTLLYTIATTEGWTDAMSGAMITTGDSGCNPDAATCGLNCCGSIVAIPYFVLFMITGSVVALNLFIAVLLDTFQTENEIYSEEMRTRVQCFQSIHDQWLEQTPEALELLPASTFITIMRTMPAELLVSLGLATAVEDVVVRNDAALMRFFSRLELPVLPVEVEGVDGPRIRMHVSYRSVQWAVGLVLFQLEPSDAHRVRQVVDKVNTGDSEEDFFKIRHYFAAKKVAEVARHLLAKRRERNLSPRRNSAVMTTPNVSYQWHRAVTSLLDSRNTSELVDDEEDAPNRPPSVLAAHPRAWGRSPMATGAWPRSPTTVSPTYDAAGTSTEEEEACPIQDLLPPAVADRVLPWRSPSEVADA